MFLALILDRIVSGYFRAIEQVGAFLDEIDEALILRGVQSDAEEGLLGRLVGVSPRHHGALRSLAAHREMFATLAQPEFDKVSEIARRIASASSPSVSRRRHRDRERPPDGDGIAHHVMTRTTSGRTTS